MYRFIAFRNGSPRLEIIVILLKEFNCEIYPRKLWVATSWEEVKDRFSVYHAYYAFEKHNDADGTVYPHIERKSTRKRGVLIVFNFEERIGGSEIVNIIAHESLHAANAIFNELGIEYELTHDEHAAYMVGWIAKCCWKVLQKEVYRDDKEQKSS